MIDAARPRWRGQRGRLEVWYASATDTNTGLGLWLHHELVAPPEGNPYAHGWLATFPRDGAPTVVRFGPSPATPGSPDEWMRTPTTSAAPGRFSGKAGDTAWDLSVGGDDPPLWTFPAYAWQRELLPSAQVVAQPRATFTGTITVGDEQTTIGARGNVAHIYGHGNAQRWAWLHADLDEETVLEVIAAVGRRPAMRRLPPIAFVQVRRDGAKDWPADPLLAAPLFRCRLDLPTWTVRGVVGRRRLTARVTQPPERCVTLDYADPDGAPAACTNTEIADVSVRLDTWRGRWLTEAEWSLSGTAHAEVGRRDDR